jgi:hypothetical protein
MQTFLRRVSERQTPKKKEDRLPSTTKAQWNRIFGIFSKVRMPFKNWKNLSKLLL